MTPLVVGVDAGGTTTRCLVATVDGEVVTAARGPGANRWSSGENWADHLAEVIGTALVDIDPRRVAAGCFGIAGASSSFPEDQVIAYWRERALPGKPVVVEDSIVSYAAGSVEPEGLLLLSGTGATATWVRGFATMHRCDGVGWWLGDEGSAVWIARAAVQAVLAALDGRGPDTTLVSGVTEGLLADRAAELTGRQLADAVVAAVYENAPAALGRIAPLIDAHARVGDPVAYAIAADAAQRLLGTLWAAQRSARQAGADDLPVVLAGSVLVGGSLVGDLVKAAVRERIRAEPQLARDGAAGAAALAVRQVVGTEDRARAAHERLIDAVRPTMGPLTGTS